MKLAQLAFACAIAITSVSLAAAPTTGSDRGGIQTFHVGDRLPRWGKLKEGTNRYLRYRVEGGRRIAMDIWSRTIRFEPDPVTGRKRLRILQDWNGATLPAERKVDSWFEDVSFRPLTHRTKRESKGVTTSAAFIFTAAAVTGDPSVPDNSQAALKVATPEPTYNFETDLEFLTTLPWRENYAARINFYHPSGDAPEWYVYKVTGSDILNLGGRPVEAWVVAIDYGTVGDARFWIDKQTQNILKVATRGPDINGILYKILLPSE